MKNQVTTKRLGVGQITCRVLPCSTIGSLGSKLAGAIRRISLQRLTVGGSLVQPTRLSVGSDGMRALLRATVSNTTYSTKPVEVKISWSRIAYWRNTLGFRVRGKE